MIYNKIGNQSVSQMGIGGGVFNPRKDDNLDLKDAKGVIEFLVSKGVNIIDTGKSYDEVFLSKAIENVKENLLVTSKSESADGESIELDLNESIEKLGVDSLFLYQVHMVDSKEDLRRRKRNGVFRVLKNFKSEGKISNIGVFSHRCEVLREAMEMEEVDVVSTIYNAAHRRAEEIIFPHLKPHSVDFIAVAPYSNGILIDPKLGSKRNISELNPETLLKFLFSSKKVSTTIVGSRKISEAKENVDVALKKWDLDRSDKEGITKIIEDILGRKFCRGCRNCEPCTQFDELIISEILKLKLFYEKYGYKDFAKKSYDDLPSGGIYLCKKCGDCVSECPYDLDIPKKLHKSHKLLARS